MKTHLTKRTARILALPLFCYIFFVGGILMAPETLLADATISARYIQGQGTQLVVEVMTGPTPPASAILIQRFPPGVKMINSQPAVSNYNPGNNTAKWLLRNLRPGKSTVSITLDRAVRRNEVSADIRFKPQGGRSMATIQVGK